MAYILIIGAKSDIARATAREYARHGYDLYLAARQSVELEALAKDLYIRYQRDVQPVELDVLDYQSHPLFYHSLKEKPAGIICAVGYLGNQKKAEVDFNEAQKIIHANFTGIASLLNIIADDFEKRKTGFIVCISSVAGERGRRSNYIYGSAKAALTAYLSGIRNRLHHAGVPVLTVKPGYVNTRMTEGLKLPAGLTAQPEDVAKDIYRAQQKAKDILYSKWIWKWIMILIRCIPEGKFKKLSI